MHRQYFYIVCYIIAISESAIVRNQADVNVCRGENVTLNWEYNNADSMSFVIWSKDVESFMIKFGKANASLSVPPVINNVIHIQNGKIVLLSVIPANTGQYQITVTYKNGIPKADGYTQVSVKGKIVYLLVVMNAIYT